MKQERLREPIDVAVWFSHGNVIPRHFRWANRTYAVDQVNQRWTGKNGRVGDSEQCRLSSLLVTSDPQYEKMCDSLWEGVFVH